jgi:hypothetical protein
LVLGGAAYFHQHPSTAAESRNGSVTTQGRGPVYELGRSYRYRMAWKGNEVAHPFGVKGRQATKPITASMDLEADVILSAVRKNGDVTELAARFDKVGRHQLSVMGADALPSEEKAREVLEGRVALMAVDGSGHIVRFGFREGESEPFTHLVPFLLGAFEANVPADASEVWYADEHGPFGDSKARYSRQGDTVSRQRMMYSTIDGLATGRAHAVEESAATPAGTTELLLAPRGPFARILVDESVRVAEAEQASFEGSWRAEGSLIASDLAEVPTLDVASFTAAKSGPSTTVRERMMDARIAGLTTERMVADVVAFGPGGHPPDEARWMWRATGLVAKDPAAAEALGKAFETETLGPKGRALVTSVLASAGSDAAQAVLRRILKSKAVGSEPERAQLIGRLVAVSRPNAETVRFAGDMYRESKRAHSDDVANASLLAYGSVANGARRSGDAAVAAEAVRAIETEVRHASVPVERSVALRSLGNAAPAEAVETVKPWLADPAADVRASAATALRKTTDPSATATLVSLLVDPAPSVALSAIDALNQHTLGEGDIAQIFAQVRSGAVVLPAVGSLVSLVANYVGGDAPSAEAMLRYLLANPTTPPGVQAKIRGVLGPA